MLSLEMNGPYELSLENINFAITKTSPGNYALGYIDEKNTDELKKFSYEEPPNLPTKIIVKLKDKVV